MISFKSTALLAFIALAGCGSAGCCSAPANLTPTVGAVVSGPGPNLTVPVPGITIGNGGTATVPVTGGGGAATASGCPGIVSATVTAGVVNLTGIGVGTCVVLVTSATGATGTITVVVSAAPVLPVSTGTVAVPVGGTGAVTVTAAGPVTATGCPGIVNATVTANVVNITGVAAGVCAVVVMGPTGVQATVLATVSATPPIVAIPASLQLAPGATGAVALTGTGPFTATTCPGIVSATVTANILNLTALGVGVCAVVVTGPNGVKATVLANVAAAPPIAVLPAAVTLGNGGTASVPITGTGPFTATSCPGIVNATVAANVLNLAATGVGACVVVVTGPGGVQATVLANVAAATPLVATPLALPLLLPGAAAPITVSGAGPITATGCPGIVNVAVAAQVVTATAVGVGVCAVVIAGPGGVQTTVLVTT